MSRADEIHALGRERFKQKTKRVTSAAVKPKGMKPLAADFVPQKEIVAVNKLRRGGGRRLASEAHLANEKLKPWVAAKMSRRTWYRWQAEKRGAK